MVSITEQFLIKSGYDGAHSVDMLDQNWSFFTKIKILIKDI